MFLFEPRITSGTHCDNNKKNISGIAQWNSSVKEKTKSILARISGMQWHLPIQVLDGHGKKQPSWGICRSDIDASWFIYLTLLMPGETWLPSSSSLDLITFSSRTSIFEFLKSRSTFRGLLLPKYSWNSGRLSVVFMTGLVLELLSNFWKKSNLHVLHPLSLKKY